MIQHNYNNKKISSKQLGFNVIDISLQFVSHSDFYKNESFSPNNWVSHSKIHLSLSYLERWLADPKLATA